MCGRFANAQPAPQYRAAVRHQLPERRDPTPAPDADDYYPSHNVAPQTRCPIVRRELSWERERRLKSLAHAPSPADKEHQIILQTMKWGLIPRFHKTPPSHGEAYRTINARDDTILSPQRSMWHPLLPAQRCVVFVQGFYEWQKRGTGDSEKVERIPHFVGMPESGPGRTDKDGNAKRLMPLAGLYERVRFEGEDKPLYTFTIVTTGSNDQLEFLHDRMPVILPDAQAIATWLGLGHKGKPDHEDDTWDIETAKLLRPLRSPLDCYKVPREVGKVGNSDPSFILPIEERKDGLRAFFAKQEHNENATTHPQPAKEEEEEEEETLAGASDDLQPGSSFDEQQALAAAQEAENDALLTDAAIKAEQEEQDRKLAERLQRDFDAGGSGPNSQVARSNDDHEMSRSNSIVNLEAGASGDEDSNDDTLPHDRPGTDGTVSGEEIGDGFAVPDHAKGGTYDQSDEPMRSPPELSTSARRIRPKRASSLKRELRSSKRHRADSPSAVSRSTEDDDPSSADAGNEVEPSSRFSPDPYNPPLSPPRPAGGYSRRLSPASGGGVHINPKRGKSRGRPHEPFPQASPHSWKKSQPGPTHHGPMDRMLLLHQQRAQAQAQD
ncbi:DUF159-domain-containing protein, partial [Testicularia cyperi]